MKNNINLVLFYHPRACSLAPHIILEELGVPYQRCLIDLSNQDNHNSEYVKLNPTGAIPTLIFDDTALTETQAILTYLGDLSVNNKLLPGAGDPLRYRAHEWMNFLSSSIHVYIRSIFRSEVYGGQDAQVNAAVRSQGTRNLAKAISIIEQRLNTNKWALGDNFSVVDAYLFVMYLWTTDQRIPSVMHRPRWQALAERVWQRNATQKVVAIEKKTRAYDIPKAWLAED